jgi:hypothetical protein
MVPPSRHVGASIGGQGVPDNASLLMWRLHSARQTSTRGIAAGGRPDAASDATGIHNETSAFRTKRDRSTRRETPGSGVEEQSS